VTSCENKLFNAPAAPDGSLAQAACEVDASYSDLKSQFAIAQPRLMRHRK
jgi:hypothetical protein